MRRRARRPAHEDEEGYYEEEEPSFLSSEMKAYILIAVVGIIAMGAVVYVVKRAGDKPDGGSTSGTATQDPEPHIVNALRIIKSSQDIYWRDMRSPKGKCTHAKNLYDLYYKYASSQGAPPGRVTRQVVDAAAPEKSFYGYYFVMIDRKADGKPIPLTRGYGICAVPVAYRPGWKNTFLLLKMNLDYDVYKKDTNGRAVSQWPPDEELSAIWVKVTK